MDNDQATSPAELSFIYQSEVRTLVEQFHKEAVKAWEQGLYIATVVLSGAVLEGLLTFALTTRQPEAQQKFREKYGKKADDRPLPRDWYLTELIDIAHSMNLVGESAKDGAWAVKDFRNLIHPCKLLDRSRPRWRALATAALAAIEDISASLAGRLASQGSQP